MATTYKRLELNGLPTTDSPGFAGVVMKLVVLKQDAYGQTVTADSSSSLQVFPARDGERDANDESVSFLGATITVFEKGRAHLPIAVKPTFASPVVSRIEVRTALLRQPYLYMAGTDVATGIPMQTNVVQVYLALTNRSASSVCPTGYVLTLDTDNAAGRPGGCTRCKSGSHSLNSLVGPHVTQDPG